MVDANHQVTALFGVLEWTRYQQRVRDFFGPDVDTDLEVVLLECPLYASRNTGLTYNMPTLLSTSRHELLFILWADTSDENAYTETIGSMIKSSDATGWNSPLSNGARKLSKTVYEKLTSSMTGAQCCTLSAHCRFFTTLS